MEQTYLIGNCDNGYSCVYMNSISWRTPTTPIPMETNPRVVFQRLFGDGGDGGRAARADARGSQHPRLGDRRHGPPAAEARARRPRHASTSTSIRSARSSGAFRSPSGSTSDSPLDLPDRPVGVPGIVRRARQADVRSAGAGLPGRHHPRVHVHARQGADQPGLPGARRQRGAPCRVAPPATIRSSWRRRPRSTPTRSAADATSSRS